MLEFTKLIPIVALCLAFSMVSERIANFLKLYLPAFTKLIPFKYSIEYLKKSAFVLDNLHLKQTDQELEVIRERIILLLSLISGLLVAIIFQTEIEKTIGKSPVDRYINLKILSFGVLFSFGSKFWHDMLDLLLFTKNLRRRWGEIDVNEFSSAKQLSDRLQVTDQDLVKQAIEENKGWLYRDFPSIRIILPRYELFGDAYQHCVAIYLEKEDEGRIPKYLPVSEKNITVPVKVFIAGSVVAHGVPGDRVNLNGDSTFGTFGCLVKSNEDEKNYILTCGHVVTGRKSNFDPNSLIGKSFSVAPDTNIPFKKILFQTGIDCALIGPVANSQHRNIPKLKNVRPLTKDDNKTEISVKSNSRGEQKGKIVEFNHSNVTVEYADGSMLFPTMIMAESKSAINKLSVSGDSGSIMYDDNGFALGLIIGGDNYYSYAIALYDVALLLDIEIS